MMTKLFLGLAAFAATFATMAPPASAEAFRLGNDIVCFRVTPRTTRTCEPCGIFQNQVIFNSGFPQFTFSDFGGFQTRVSVPGFVNVNVGRGFAESGRRGRSGRSNRSNFSVRTGRRGTTVRIR